MQTRTPYESNKDIMERITGSTFSGKARGLLEPLTVTSASTATSNFGQPLPSVSRSLNIGGYPIVSDVHLMEKQQTFNRSKICERMVHPCGAGAFGYFETTKDMSEHTKANFLSGKGTKTPIFIRFSTVTYGREYPDSARNPRGFAIKFYTKDGNYDLVGLNFPVFFVRDPMQGPDVIRSQQRNPQSFLLNKDATLDFIGGVPESMHAATMFFSDFGTPVGFRQMHGYGCHTFKWVNAQGEQFFVKYHFLSENGIKNFTDDEAALMCGRDPDFAKRDLYEHLEKGEAATWKACVQIMPAEKAAECKFDPFDVTKVWPRREFPMIEMGRLVVNRNPESYHRDVEQAAFHPGSLVPGIEPSPDMLLNFRMFFYRDTQLYRLGVNLHQIPVNCPFAASTYHPAQSRDGLMRVDQNGAGECHYFPNSVVNSPMPDAKADYAPVQVQGNLQRGGVYKHEGKDSEYDQCRELYLRVMSQTDREHLFRNIANWMKGTRAETQRRFLTQCYKVHPSYAEGVMKAFEGTFNFKLEELGA